MILRAKWVLPADAPPIENGAVTVEGDSIVAVGPSTGEGRDLGEVVLAPGLINAHCHFDYPQTIPFRGKFADWIFDLVAWKKQQTEEGFRAAIAAGIQQALDAGTTTVVNIASLPALVVPSALRIIWCEEIGRAHV